MEQEGNDGADEKALVVAGAGELERASLVFEHLGVVDAVGAKLVDLYVHTLQSEQSKKTTYESFARLARAVRCKDFRFIPWQELGVEEMFAMKAGLTAQHAPATANLSLVALRQVMKIGHLMGKVSDKQLALSKMLGTVRGSRLTAGSALESDEIARLWTACRTDVTSEVLELQRASPEARQALWGGLFAALLGAGLRREEGCDLRLDQLAHDSLAVIGKGNKERRIPFDTLPGRRLGWWREARLTLKPDHHFLFCSPLHGRKLQPWTLWFLLGELGRHARVDFAPHDLRRTFASRLLAAGMQLEEVQRLMGHASPNTTARYDKRTEKALAIRRRSMQVWTEEEEEGNGSQSSIQTAT